MTPSRERKIEEAANNSRARLFVVDALPLELETALSRIGDLQMSPRPTFMVESDDTCTNDLAYTDCGTKTIHISASTFEGVRRGDPRARFTVAHELGHLVLGHEGVRSRVALGKDRRVQAGVRSASQDEEEANYFARAFLMPERVAEDFKNSAELARRCGVSEKTAQIRLNDLARRRRQENGEQKPLPLTPEGAKILAEIYRNAGASSRNADIQSLLSRGRGRK